MKELIKIHDNNGTKAVSAKELYINLGLAPNHWSRWYNKNIIKNKFAIENEDWFLFTLEGSETKRGKFGKDFVLSIDFAKKICMLSRTPKGEELRNYFIKTENQLTAIKSAVNNYANDPIISMRMKQIEIEDRVLKLESKNTTRPDYFTIAGYGNLNGVSVNLKIASRLGRMASKICKEKGLVTDKIPDPRFGVVKMYPTSVLDEVFNNIAV